MVAAFARVEVKYDCVWNHACGTLQSELDAFGNKPKNLPNRVQQTRRSGYGGNQKTFDTRPYWFDDRERHGSRYYDVPAGQREASSFTYGPTLAALFGASAGPDERLGPFQDIRHERATGFRYGNGWTDPTTMLPGDDDAGLFMFNRTSLCQVEKR